MRIATISSSELNPNVSRAKMAAKDGPVLITERGKPAYVLPSYERYQRILGKGRNVVEALSMPDLSDIEIKSPRSRDLPRPADFD